MRKSVLTRIAEAGVRLQLAEQRWSEADKEVRAARHDLEQLIASATGGDVVPDADDSTTSGDASSSITDQVKAWFDAHPGVEARAQDLIADGVDGTVATVRATMNRLWHEEYLAKSDKGKGLYLLPVKEAKEATDAPDAQESAKPKHQRGLRQIGGSAA